MDIKVLFDNLVGDNIAFRSFNNPYNLLFEKNIPVGLSKTAFIDDEFSYNMFEKSGDLYEFNLIKNYHIGENPLVEDDSLNLDNFVIIDTKFYGVC